MANGASPQLQQFLRRYNVGGINTGTGAPAGTMTPGGSAVTYGAPAQQQMTPNYVVYGGAQPVSAPAQTCACPDCGGTVPIQHGGAVYSPYAGAQPAQMRR